MGEKRDGRGVPIRLGDDLDDDEATALDLSRADVAALAARRVAEQDGAWAEAEAAPPKRPPPPSVADDDPDKTEMLERPDFGELTGGAAPRGVVPLGEDAAKLLGKANRAPAEPSHTELIPAIGDDSLSDEAETVMLARPSSLPVRALDELSLPSIDSEPSDERTLSRPQIARATFGPDRANVPSTGGATTPGRSPPPRPLPPPPSPRQRPAGPPSALGAQGSDEAAEGGTLVVDAPPDAAVFIDGVERGVGRVEVPGLDHCARIAVRVHRAGFKPWSRTLSLEGKAELHLVPDLDPR